MRGSDAGALRRPAGLFSLPTPWIYHGVGLILAPSVAAVCRSRKTTHCNPWISRPGATQADHIIANGHGKSNRFFSPRRVTSGVQPVGNML